MQTFTGPPHVTGVAGLQIEAADESNTGVETIMKFLLTRKHTHLAMACALALGVMSGTAFAQTTAGGAASQMPGQGYVVNGQGTVWRNAAGDCWRTDFNPAATSREQCEPAPVARVVTPAPRPAEMAQAEPVRSPPPAPVIMTLNADALFDLNSAAVRPAGKVQLDRFARDIRGMNPEMITAVGHTDRLGSAAYNQRLSEQRAEAVKAYLVSQGIAANRIQASGKGATQPVTESENCTGPRSERLINCLQPDRRVEILVSGTRTSSR